MNFKELLNKVSEHFKSVENLVKDLSLWNGEIKQINENLTLKLDYRKVNNNYLFAKDCFYFVYYNPENDIYFNVTYEYNTANKIWFYPDWNDLENEHIYEVTKETKVIFDYVAVKNKKK